MTNEDLKTIAAIATPSLVVIGRLWSMWEHRQTGKSVRKTERDITEIKISINGELEKRVEQAREEGRQEERLKMKK